MKQEGVFHQSVYPLIEVVTINGEPIWQVCGSGICTRHRAGSRALESFWAQCSKQGIEMPQ
jgi:hypothetical protein